VVYITHWQVLRPFYFTVDYTYCIFSTVFVGSEQWSLRVMSVEVRMQITITKSVLNTSFCLQNYRWYHAWISKSLLVNTGCKCAYIYRTLTNLLCKVYLSRHLYCQPLVFMVWVLHWGMKICWNIHSTSYIKNFLSSIVLSSNMEVNSASPCQNVLGSNLHITVWTVFRHFNHLLLSIKFWYLMCL
jgi:hypothetical protein